MKQLISLTALLSIVAFVSCDPASPEADNANTINAFTSASSRQSLKISASKVYETYADIRWSESWEDVADVTVYRLRWGAQSGAYTDSLNLKPYQHQKITTTKITGLLPGTLYKAEFVRVYSDELYNVAFKFATPPLQNVAPQ